MTLPEEPRDLRPEHFPVRRDVPTRWSDVDAYGHVNNVVHYALFDTVVNAWLIEASGTDVRALPAIGLVVETSCRYLAELDFPGTVTAGLALERRGRTSVVYRLALWGPGHEAPAAVGRFVHVYVDRQTRRPVPPPPAVQAALDGLERAAAQPQVRPGGAPGASAQVPVAAVQRRPSAVTSRTP